MVEIVYRVQAEDGRGPFRPGFSKNWTDETFTGETVPMLPWMQEFGRDLIDRKGRPGEHFGSAVRSVEQLRRWFSPTERAKLASLGFHAVSLSVDRVLAESQNQLVFARRRPMREGAIILPWPAVAEHNALAT